MMPKPTISPQILERLQQRAEQNNLSVDALVANLLDMPFYMVG